MSVRVIPRRAWTTSSPGGAWIGTPHGNLRLHHSVTEVRGGARASRASEAEACRSLRRIGLARGHGDASYNLGDFPSGSFWELRGAGRRGAHTCRHNGDLAIVCIGNYHARPSSRALRRTLRRAAAHLVRVGWIRRFAGVFNHADTGACSGGTACPGQYLYRMRDVLRRIVARVSGQRRRRRRRRRPPRAIRVPKTVRRGQRPRRVKKLQRRLNRWRKRKKNVGQGWPKLRIDGVFGARTERAVKAYQHWRRLRVDGIVGPQTWTSLLG